MRREEFEREQRELEEERQAVEEDRHRYDSVLPGLNNGLGNWRPPGEDRDGPPPLPPGCHRGLNIHSLPSQLPQTGRPENADPSAAEFLICESPQAQGVKPVEWFWPGRIPLGGVTLLVGDPNVGKSFLALEMAARVSRGRAWPDRPHEKGIRGQVLIYAREDRGAETITPRLISAGADLKQIAIIRGLAGQDHQGFRDRHWQRPIVFPEDLLALEGPLMERFDMPTKFYKLVDGKMVPDGISQPEHAEYPPVRLVILDTLSWFVPGITASSSTRVRALLQPLIELAQFYRVAIVAIEHRTKNSALSGLLRTQGNVAVASVPRAVWSVERSPEDFERRLFTPLKMNLARTPEPLSFRIQDSKLTWDERPPSKSEERLKANESSARNRERNVAAAFLLEFLADGPMPARDVRAEARRAGISIRTLHRASADLELEHSYGSLPDGRRVCWSLPAKPASADEPTG